MVTLNSTENHAVAGSAAFPLGLSGIPELEKISCSFKGASWLHPIFLMGKRIRNAQAARIYDKSCDSFLSESSIVDSTVMAVNLGSIECGIETSLLLQDSDGSDPYYADITNLTVLEILS